MQQFMSNPERTRQSLPIGGARESGPTRVSVVIPMFNEEACAALLATTLEELESRYCGQLEFTFLLVDDGSTDQTVIELKKWTRDRPNYHILQHERNYGIAAAIQTGIACADDEIVASIDSDGSYDASLLGSMVAALLPDVALVTASPYHPQGAVSNVPQWRIRLSRLASSMYRAAIGEPLYCYTSCFRVYRREAALRAAPSHDGYVGVAELLLRVLLNGEKVIEYPAVLSKRVAGHSKIRVVRASLDHLKLIGRVGVRRLLIHRRRRELPTRTSAKIPRPYSRIR